MVYLWLDKLGYIVWFLYFLVNMVIFKLYYNKLVNIILFEYLYIYIILDMFCFFINYDRFGFCINWFIVDIERR